MRSDIRGFSLIEILVVLTIVGLLVTLSGGAYLRYVTYSERVKTRTDIVKLEQYAQHYNEEMGTYPPSLLKILGLNSTGSSDNEGIEAFVQALYHKEYDGEGFRPDSTAELINSDGDESDKAKTIFQSRDLFEIQDSWGNPIVYIRYTEYVTPFTYYVETEDGTLESLDVRARKNPDTGIYYNFESFQIISLGPDGLFDTEDDVTNFDRPEDDE